MDIFREIFKTQFMYFCQTPSHQKTKATVNIDIIAHKLKQICIVFFCAEEHYCEDKISFMPKFFGLLTCILHEVK